MPKERPPHKPAVRNPQASALEPPAAFITLTQALGELQNEMAILGWGAVSLDGEGDKSSLGHMDFTGLREERSARERTAPFLDRLKEKFGIPPASIWPTLYDYLPHVRRSEFDRVARAFAGMKKALWGDVRRWEQVRNNAIRIKHPPFPPPLLKGIEDAYEAAKYGSAKACVKRISRLMARCAKRFKQRGNIQAQVALKKLVRTIVQADPQHDHAAACKLAYDILKAWAADKAPTSPEAIRQRTITETIQKKKRRRTTLER